VFLASLEAQVRDLLTPDAYGAHRLGFRPGAPSHRLDTRPRHNADALRKTADVVHLTGVTFQETLVPPSRPRQVAESFEC